MIALNIRLKQDYSKIHEEAIDKINTARKNDEFLGKDIYRWIILLEQVKQETGIEFNHKVSENGENIIEEEGYVEPTPDPMFTYMEDLGTYNNIKATHELGIISDEEMEESSEYMKSIYPSEKSTLARIKMDKPILFEKFRNYR